MKISDTFQVTMPSDTEVRVTREFDAPRAAVWAAHTQPELLKRWLTGPPGWSLTRCELDLRAGGKAHYEWKGPDGNGFGLDQRILEAAPPSRFVAEERFDMGGGVPMPTQHATLVLEESGGRTQMTLTLRYADKAARDGALASGMDQGMAAGYDQLDRVLVSQKV
jgi:uncharacterized protein YndB with AHSA1/START domain